MSLARAVYVDTPVFRVENHPSYHQLQWGAFGNSYASRDRC